MIHEHYWRQIIRDILPASLLEQVSNHQSDLIIVQELLTNFQLLVDSAEQPINRTDDKIEQQNYYSGKKKQHTRSWQFVGLPEAADIVDVEVGLPSPRADIHSQP